ncbi:MAG: potassium transporter KtrB [Clostridia bacterium]|nr:potassium transporter KtrB [Clostridia bacterium]
MKIKLSTTQIIMLSFLMAILLGALILCLPISSASGNATPFIDALFTSTTSVCVTGLVVVPTFSHWSVFGKAVILLLIQAGGLGIITVTAGIFFNFKKKLSLNNSVLIQDAFNLNTLSGLSAFIRKVISGTFLVELIGALCYMTVFVPQFGVKGIWFSFFNSISAFCNAGIDIIGGNSLINYAENPIINLTTSLLIIIGGIGFIVWLDVIDVIKKRRGFRFLTLHSKIALTFTLILIFGGGLLYFIFEYNNPQTIKDFSLFGKIQACLFQSVTTRTAGFVSIDQSAITNASAMLSLILMFIGGSPVGTAGGIKTVTLAVILAAFVSSVKNKDETTLFSRSIPLETLKKAIAVVTMSLFIVIVSSLLLSLVSSASVIDILYETVSAAATVGLSRNLTPFLNQWGKLIVTATMYLGRVGPISLAFLFKTKKTKPAVVKNPTEKISVG